MKAGRYSIKEIFVNRHVQKIIVPEIQRDYVWEREQVHGLLNSIFDSYTDFCNYEPNFIDMDSDKEFEEDFRFFFRKRKYSANVGFIYAYSDSQYAGNYFLIDGQQRITTLILLFLALATTNEKCKEYFWNTYFQEGKLKFEYKVREETQVFLGKFIQFLLEGGSDQPDNQTWYFNCYKNDTTIQSIVKNYKTISSWVKEKIQNTLGFFDYLENCTECWYFDTNISEQGEELYIYMNARGERMQGNENLKADLLGKIKYSTLPVVDESKISWDKNKWGLEWERWQDIFWQHRGDNSNADKGYNEFLFCIAGLENYRLNRVDDFYSKEIFEKRKSVLTSDLINAIGLERISIYISALEFLCDKNEEFKQIYTFSYCGWVDKFIECIWALINGKKEKNNELETNWFADYTDENRAVERNRMVLLWSTFFYLTENQLYLDCEKSFRILRVFYLRYYNYIRSVTSINKNIFSLENDFLNLDYRSEEQEKENYLKNILNLDERRKIESVLWQIEDHPLNLDGKDVGGTNISYLIDLKNNPDLSFLELVRDKFYDLFKSEKQKILMQSILLYYGEYWYRVSPWYYENYEFNNWRKIIRGHGKNCNVFQVFFHEFLKFDGSLIDFLKSKRDATTILPEAKTLQQILLWYNNSIQEKMWGEGGFIAIRSWDENDQKFPEIKQITNTKGSFKGGSPKILFDLLPDSNKVI